MGNGSTHFLNVGVPPTAAGTADGMANRPSATPAPPIAPRLRTCRLVSIVAPSARR
jgi:hypothetical protein